jgi:hypothetical protein
MATASAARYRSYDLSCTAATRSQSDAAAVLTVNQPQRRKVQPSFRSSNGSRSVHSGPFRSLDGMAIDEAEFKMS